MYCILHVMCVIMDIAGVLLCDWYLCTSWLLAIKCLVLLQRPNKDHNHLCAILTMTLINIQSYRLWGFRVIDGTRPQSLENVLNCSRLYVLLFLWLSALRLTGVHHYLWSIDGIFPFSPQSLSPLSLHALS